MDRYQTMFARLKELNQGAFVPFVTLGDPDLHTSYEIVEQLLASGADALELGMPFSDPIADGPTLQQASIRALHNQVTPTDCFALIAKIRAAHNTVPIGLLLYSNLVMAKGIGHFYQQAAQAGVDSILVADVPVREVQPFVAASRQHAVKQVLIAPPNATDTTLHAIAEQGAGYTYLLGRSGVTGAETAVQIPSSELLAKLDKYAVAPPVIGFGISTPEQVTAAIKAGAAGAIAGSATVNIIAQHLDDKERMLAALGQFVTAMKAATQI